MHRPLDHGLVQMVAASLAGDRFEVRACRRKHPLPRPLAPRVGVLPPKRMRHLHPSGSGSEVALVLQPYPLEVTAKPRSTARRCPHGGGGSIGPIVRPRQEAHGQEMQKRSMTPSPARLGAPEPCTAVVPPL